MGEGIPSLGNYLGNIPQRNFQRFVIYYFVIKRRKWETTLIIGGRNTTGEGR